MGNLLCVAALWVSVMAATAPRLGIAHVTVVPTNLDEDGDDEDGRT
ncbi:MAG: hypothetical protein ABEJ34_01010 [Haloferacaceae archaeon]